MSFFVPFVAKGKSDFMEYLGMELSALTEKHAVHTAREISQQPDLWLEVWQGISEQRTELEEFMNVALRDSRRIILIISYNSRMRKLYGFLLLTASGPIYRRATTMSSYIMWVVCPSSVLEEYSSSLMKFTARA